MSEARNAQQAGFDGRRVVVVGAAGALGAGLITAFGDGGASVVGYDRRVPDAQDRLPGTEYRAVDVLDDDSLTAAFDDGPPPWAVVNVVGGFAPSAPLTELDAEQLATQLHLNLTSAALITKHALRRMSEAAEGRLIHTASRAALSTAGTAFSYSVSKLGVLHLVKMAADETHGTAITVNAVVPSIMDTPANRAAMPSAPHDKWPKVQEVAAVYVFLASPAAHLISGATVPVYGLV